MSNTIDNRIVSMKFDNAQFEEGAKESLSTIDRLKESLSKLTGFGKVDTSGIDTFGNAVDATASKFSWLEEIAVGALRHIGEMAVDAVTGILDYTIFDNISSGWEKYAEETNAVQTLMTATRKRIGLPAEQGGWADELEQMEAVEREAEKLGWFADETSYSYDQMVNAAGRFTASGVEMEDAVSAAQGIAAWAGLNGVGIQKAGTAFEAFATSMATGYVTLRDWRRLQQILFTTPEFNQALIDAGVAAGTLTKNMDGLYSVVGNDKIEAFDANSLEASLTKGKWATKEVLSDTLSLVGKTSEELYQTMNLFGYGTEDQYFGTASELVKAVKLYKAGQYNLAEVAEETGITLETVTRAFDSLASAENELGLIAFEKSYEAKTFKDAWDAVADAASTQWKNIFKNIFGNYQQAKELWTSVSEELIDLFVGPIYDLVALTDAWNEKGGRDLLIEGVANAWENFRNILDAVSEGFGRVFGSFDSDALVNITRGFKNLTERTKLGEGALGAISKAAELLAWPLRIVGDLFGGLVSIVGKTTGAFLNFVTTNETVQKIVEGIGNAFTRFGWHFQVAGTYVNDLWNTVRTSLGNIATEIGNTLATNGALEGAIIILGDAFDKLGWHLSRVPYYLQEFWKAFKATPAFTIFKTTIDGLITTIKTYLNPVIEKAKEKFGDFLKNFSNTDSVDGINYFKEAAEKFGKALEFLGDQVGKIKNVLKGFADYSGLTEFAKKFRDGVVDLLEGEITLESIVEKLLQLKDHIVEVLKGIAKAFISGEYNPVTLAKKAWEGMKNIGESLTKGWKESLVEELLDLGKKASLAFVLTGIMFLLLKFFNFLRSLAQIPIDLHKVFGGLKSTLSSVATYLDTKSLLNIVEAIGILAAAVIALGSLNEDMANRAKTMIVLVARVIGEVGGIMIALELIRRKGGGKDPGTALAMLGDTMKEGIKKLGSVASVGVGILAFGAAIALLVSVMDDVLKITKEEYFIAAGRLGGIAVSLGIAAGLMARMPATGMGTAANLLALSMSVGIIVLLVEKVGAIQDWSPLGEMLVIGAVLVGAAKLLNNVNISPKTAASMMLFSLAIDLLVPALLLLTAFGGENGEAFAAAMAVAAAVVGLSYASTKVDVKGMVAMAGGFITLAAAILLMTPALIEFGLNWQEGVIGLRALGAALMVFLGLGALVGHFTFIAVGIIAIGGAIALVGAGLLMGAEAFSVFTDAIGRFGDNIVHTSEVIKNSGTSISEALLVLINNATIAIQQGTPAILMMVVTLVTSVITGACIALVQGAADIVLAILQALMIIVDTLRQAVPTICEILYGLVDTIVGGVIRYAVGALEHWLGEVPLIGPLLDKGVEWVDKIFHFGEDLGTGLVEGMDTGVTEKLPQTEDAVEKVVDSAKNTISNSDQDFTTSGAVIPERVAQGVTDNAGKVDTAVGYMMSGSFTAIQGFNPQMESTASGLIDTFSNTITAKSSEVGTATSTVGGNVLATLQSYVPQINTSGADWIGMVGLTGGMDSQKGGVFDMSKMIGDESLLQFTNLIPDYNTAGVDQIMAAVTGQEEAKPELVGMSETISVETLDKFKENMDEYRVAGNEIDQNVGMGIDENRDVATTAANDMAQESLYQVEEVEDDFYHSGKNAGGSFAEGIRDEIESAASAAAALARAALDAANAELGINSPSKEFIATGRSSDEGFAIGLVKYLSLVAHASDDVAKTAMDGVKEAMAHVGDAVDEDFNTSPVIRPVVDLSAVQNGAALMNGMLGGNINTGVMTGLGYMSPQQSMLETVNGLIDRITAQQEPYGDIIINITGGDNATAKDIADEVIDRVNTELQRRKAAWG